MGERVPGLRRGVAVAGLLGGLAGLLLAVLSLHGPLAGLDPRTRGLAGLTAGFIVYAAWYASSVLTGGTARAMGIAEILESLVAFYLTLLPAWIGFYNALLD